MRFLIVALFTVLASSVSAQEAQGVAAEGPSSDKQSQGRASADQSNAWKSALPVTIIENPDQASHATEREAKSDDHEAKDLDAQERAADAAERGAAAAERQVIPTWAQAAFAAIGMVLLLYSLHLTRRATVAAATATNAAIESNDDARRHFAIEQRPWLSFGRPQISSATDGDTVQVYFRISAENIGKSPALQVELKTEVSLIGLPAQSVVAVRRFGEACSRIESTWENDHRLIFQGKDRELWAYSEEIIDTARPPHFVRINYCAIYKANGIERALVTAGEVIFAINAPDPRNESLSDIDRYIFYGTGFAT